MDLAEEPEPIKAEEDAVKQDPKAEAEIENRKILNSLLRI